MNEPSFDPPSPSWYWIAAMWFGMGLFHATQTVVVMRAQGMHHAWFHLFTTLLLSWVPWALATPVIFRLGYSYPLLPFHSLSPWLRHFAVYVSIGFLGSGWIALLEQWLNPWTPDEPPPPFFNLWHTRFNNQILSAFILYGCILLVGHMLESRERFARQQTEAARLSEELSRAQLSTLRQQLEPHFLFNALNAISGLVREGRNEDATSMIAGLSDLLRHVLADSHRQQVCLGEELAFLEKYLAIQKVRFADRLQLDVDFPEDLQAARVPCLILQPIVENAVKHGIARRTQGGLIQIQAARSNGTLTLRVYNDGPTLPAGWAEGPSGIGMANVRTRLRSLYGDSFVLDMHNHDSRGVEVSVSIPFQEA